MTQLPDPWQFFAKIYCISIESRKDRRREAKKQFETVGILDRVEFILVKKHLDNPEKGIFQSHMQCLRKGLEEGAENILIFEDDVLFHDFNPQNLHQATQFLTNTPSWNAFFAGAITSTIQKTSTPALSKVNYRCLAHAYALNRPFAKEFIQEPWNNIPYDNLLSNHCQDFFALTPMIAFQSQATTDNNTPTLVTIRRLFGGLSFIQRANEFYQHHKAPILISHLFFLIILFLITGKLLRN